MIAAIFARFVTGMSLLTAPAITKNRRQCERQAFGRLDIGMAEMKFGQ